MEESRRPTHHSAMKFLSLPALVTLAAFAVTCKSAALSPGHHLEAIPGPVVGLRGPCKLPSIAGPSGMSLAILLMFCRSDIPITDLFGVSWRRPASES